MRIGIAHIEYSRRKGIERNSAELADRIAARGHEVHFHCAKWMDTSLSRVVFHRVSTLNIVNSTRILSYAMLSPWDLKRGRYDLTHSHGGIVGCDVITAHSCHRAGMEIRQGLKGKMIGGRINFGMADRIRLVIEHENYGKKRYKRVIAVSHGVKREIIEYYSVPEEDIEVIPNGVNLEEFNPQHVKVHRERIRRQLGLQAEHFVLIFVGHEFDRKGLEFVLRALPHVRLKEIQLLVVGDDNRVPYLRLSERLRLENQVLFLGSVTDISSYYAASDVFILPTFYEAFSLAVLEAAASGLPLLVTKVNGTEEFVIDGANGYFINRDPEDIAEKIRLLISDNEKLRALSLNARRTAENYSWDQISESFLTVYREVVDMNRT